MAHRSGPSAILLIVLTCCLSNLPAGCRAAEPSGWLLSCPQIPDSLCEPYLPQPGDIILFARKSVRARILYTLAHTSEPYHSGIIVQLPDGRFAVLEAGPYNDLSVYLLDVLPRLRTQEGCIWVRRRGQPLTPEQSSRLTAFALDQTGKRFALFRLMLEATPFHAHGQRHSRLFGSARIDRCSWFCSELVVAALAVVGCIDPHVMKPNTIYPRDLYQDSPFDLSPCWERPRKWVCEP